MTDATPSTWTPESIRALRRALTLSQEELAERVGTRAATVGRWERGRQRPLRFFRKRLDEIASSQQQGGE